MQSNTCLTDKKIKIDYQLSPSLLKHLPWVEFDDESGVILLQDNTVCAALTISLLSSETKPLSALASLRNNLQGLFQDTFTLYRDKESPWIMQCYLEDNLSMQSLYRHIQQSIQPLAQGQRLTETYLKQMQHYCDWLARSAGLFTDNKVTDTRFRGRERQVKIVIYRQYQKTMALPQDRSVIADLQQMVTRLSAKLTSTGLRVERLQGEAFRNWLIRWFNPRPAITEGSTDQLLQALPYPKADEQPFGYDFAEQLFFSTPQSDEKQGVWWFDQLPHRYLPIEQLTRIPDVGQLTHEYPKGDYRYSLFDKFPQGCVFVLTVVLLSQAQVQQHLDRIEGSARKSASMTADMTFEDCQQAKREIEQQNYLFPTSMGVYCRGETIADLRHHITDIEALLINHGFQVLHQDHNLVPLHHYLHYLPCNYRYDFDKRYLSRSRYIFGKQLANLLPLYGRQRGTGHPLLQFFNRGGESLTLDPFHPQDKDNNSHLLILGSTGSGKSATSTDLLIRLMATYRPYLVMVDAGNSFHLLKEYFIEQGLSVHHVSVTLQHPPILNPFAESDVMLKQIDAMPSDTEQTVQTIDEVWQEESDTDSQSVSRDYLGEMALSCQLMMTGGEIKEQEKLTRQDRLLILEALINAARTAKAAGHNQMIASDVVKCLREMAATLEQQQCELPKAQRLGEMADSLAFFTQDTLARRVFNQHGQPWPDADVILFEQGIFKDAGYETHNALAFMGLMARTMAKAEARQFEERFTLLYGDEIHTLTKNPLTVIYLTQCAKMSRKFGLWLWFATQNVADFPADAKKILSMMEFWLCLGTSAAEIEAIETFRPLSDEERGMFQSIRKASKKYVEGVLLCPRMTTLFRNVPPRLSLALAMTEKVEKAERKKLMEQHAISELDAAKIIAERLTQSQPE